MRVLIALAALASAAACAEREVKGYSPPAGSWPAPPPPPVVLDTPAPPDAALRMPAPLAADPEAQRFHALRRLVEAGLVRPDEADARRNTNLGALLPFTLPPPAQGLARPAPLQEIADQLARLSVQPGGLPSAPERGLLLDGVLPLEPKTRALPVRTDAAALALGRNRVGRLAELGLVSPDEGDRELNAIARGEQVLANTPPPPPAPPPQKKKPVRKKPAGAGGELKPGDVPGGAIPPTGKGPLGLHLLSMASDSLTDKAVDALKKEYPELGALTFKAVKTEIPDLGTTYRLLAGPLPQAEAEQMCKALRAKGQSCAVAGY